MIYLRCPESEARRAHYEYRASSASLLCLSRAELDEAMQPACAAASWAALLHTVESAKVWHGFGV